MGLIIYGSSRPPSGPPDRSGYRDGPPQRNKDGGGGGGGGDDFGDGVMEVLGGIADGAKKVAGGFASAGRWVGRLFKKLKKYEPPAAYRQWQEARKRQQQQYAQEAEQQRQQARQARQQQLETRYAAASTAKQQLQTAHAEATTLLAQTHEEAVAAFASMPQDPSMLLSQALADVSEASELFVRTPGYLLGTWQQPMSSEVPGAGQSSWTPLGTPFLTSHLDAAWLSLVAATDQ